MVKDKEEQLESVKAEMLTYKKKLTTLAKTMKAPMDERRNLELEIATAKVAFSCCFLLLVLLFEEFIICRDCITSELKPSSFYSPGSGQLC